MNSTNGVAKNHFYALFIFSSAGHKGLIFSLILSSWPQVRVGTYSHLFSPPQQTGTASTSLQTPQQSICQSPGPLSPHQWPLAPDQWTTPLGEVTHPWHGVSTPPLSAGHLGLSPATCSCKSTLELEVASQCSPRATTSALRAETFCYLAAPRNSVNKGYEQSRAPRTRDHEWDEWYLKWQKWGSSEGWLGFPVEIRWGARSLRRSSE